MTATVRVFFHTSLTTAPVSSSSGRYTTDSVALLKQPYVGRSAVTVGSGSALSTTEAPTATQIAFVQVQNGKSVHYEVNPPNRTIPADTSSPILSGSTQFNFGPGWTLSLLEVTE